MRRRNRARVNRKPLAIVASLAVVTGILFWNMLGGKDSVDYTGTWTITNTVEKSSYKAYIGEVYVYKMFVTHDGKNLRGEGEQTRYNEKEAKHHYPIAFTDGIMKGDELIMTYKMQARREITGQFILRPDPFEKGVLRGTFTSSGANSIGTCLVRIERP